MINSLTGVGTKTCLRRKFQSSILKNRGYISPNIVWQIDCINKPTTISKGNVKQDR